MATAHVQAAASANASSATPTVAFSSNVTAGNAICGFVYWASNSITLDSVADGLSNTYTPLDNPTTNIIWRGALFYALNITGGSCTITATFSSAVASLLLVDEVSGAATTSAVDGHGVNFQN